MNDRVYGIEGVKRLTVRAGGIGKVIRTDRSYVTMFNFLEFDNDTGLRTRRTFGAVRITEPVEVGPFRLSYMVREAILSDYLTREL